MSKRIGIIGAGTAGLQLGLFLRQNDIEATIYTDKRFYGDYHAPSRAIDYRIYHPQLMEDFTSQGGKIEYRVPDEDDVATLEAQHDLIVVCTGKGTFGKLFARDPEHSPHQTPQRALCVGVFKGIKQLDKRAVVWGASPGHGEMIEIPYLTFGGMATALVRKNHIGGDLEILRSGRPPRYCPGGTTALALGDVNETVDPVLGQGATWPRTRRGSSARRSSRRTCSTPRFVEIVDARRRDRVLAATRWTNFMLGALDTLPPDFQAFIGALAQNRALADEFTDIFNFPEKQWDIFANPERIGAWLTRERTPDQLVGASA
jgi:hypothetical protein